MLSTESTANARQKFMVCLDNTMTYEHKVVCDIGTGQVCSNFAAVKRRCLEHLDGLASNLISTERAINTVAASHVFSVVSLCQDMH